MVDRERHAKKYHNYNGKKSFWDNKICLILNYHVTIIEKSHFNKIKIPIFDFNFGELFFFSFGKMIMGKLYLSYFENVKNTFLHN